MKSEHKRPDAAEAAVRMLARRGLTRQELAARLAGKGYEAAEVEAVCLKLLDWGYLDDCAVAVRAVAECLERRPRGRALLEAELAQRGVPAPMIGEALAAYGPEREEALACLALKRLGLRPSLSSKDRAKAWRALARLGFAEPTLERICGLPDP